MGPALVSDEHDAWLFVGEVVNRPSSPGNGSSMSTHSMSYDWPSVWFCFEVSLVHPDDLEHLEAAAVFDAATSIGLLGGM